MKFELILLGILLQMSTVSAETLNVNACDVVFNMSQPHEVSMPRSQIYRNDTHVSEIDMINISSTKGFVIMTIIRSNQTNQLSFADSIRAADNDIWRADTPINTIEIDDKNGWYMINYINNIPVYTIMYYIQNPSEANYISSPNCNETTICSLIISTLPIYDTADFLRSLHIGSTRVA